MNRTRTCRAAGLAMPRVSRQAIGLIALLWGGMSVIGGCVGAGERAEPVVRDSAGITIVENPASLARQPFWTVAPASVVEIGALEGEDAYQLSRVSAAVRLADGRIVIANGGTNEVRYFDPTGRHLHSVGRDGEGPGEFRGLGTLAVLPGDSVAAHDWRLGRTAYFGPDGMFVRSVNIDFPAGRPIPIGRFADGTWLCQRAFTFAPGEDGSAIIRDTLAYLVFNASGALRDSIGSFPAPEFYIRTAGRSAMATSLPFGRTTEAAVVGDRFYAGHTERYEILRYTPRGDVELIVRLGRPPVALGTADLDRYKAERLDGAEPAVRQQTARNLEEMPYPSTYPAFADLTVDPDGNLWVLDYAAPGSEERRWTVFSPEGRALGSVITPPGLRVLEIGRDYVLGVWQDELDVEFVRLHRLDRSGPAGA